MPIISRHCERPSGAKQSSLSAIRILRRWIASSALPPRNDGFIIFMACLLLIFPVPSGAQTTTQTYSPPPMFGAPKNNKERPKKDVLIKPAIAPKVEDKLMKPAPDARPYIKEQKSTPRELGNNKPAAKGVVKGAVTMKPTPAPPVEKEEIRTAAPVKTTYEPFTRTLPYDSGVTDVSEDTRKILGAMIVPAMTASPLRLQIFSYAQPVDNSQSGDRRIALSRALSIRTYLMLQGISATRMDVRAMGKETTTAPLDRVDLVLSE